MNMKVRFLLLPAIIGALLLAGCSLPLLGRGSSSQQSAANQGSATAAPAASGAASATPTDPATRAIQAVIQKANDEQAQALARHDPTVMQDTATPAYYTELTGIQQDLESNGVSAIKLAKLEWGPVGVQGTSAQATTYETWQTTFTDGSTEQSRDRNVYALVQQNGAWKIQADAHPDSGLDQSAGASPGSTAPSGGTSPAAPGAPGTAPGRPRPGAATSAEQSNNWSGYTATGGTFTAVSGTWTVPQVTGTTVPAGDATWVGIGGEHTRDLLQAGTDATVLGTGRVRYTAWIEMLPQTPQTVPLAVSPGDSISVSLTRQADGAWQISFADHTSGQGYQTTVSYASSLSSAEWVEEAPAGGRRIVPLDNFGSVQFQNATAVKDGQRVNIAQAGGRPITMVDRSGQPIARPSALGSDGAGFSVSRLANAPSAVTPPFSRFAR